MSAQSSLVCPMPRRTLACERCKRRKVRCVPTEGYDTCQRCMKNSFSCVYPGPVQRSRHYAPRSNNSRAYHEVAPRPTSSPTSGDSPYSIEEASTQSSNSDTSNPTSGLFGYLTSLHRNVLQQILPRRPDAETTFPPRAPAISNSIPPSEPGISLTLPPDLVEKYLQRFQSWNSYFSFISLPGDHAIGKLQKEHPFLLLGILCATTIHEVELNGRLHAELLRTLSARVVVNGEENLDIIQGLLVQLAWYPVHLNPLKRQIFQILQIAASAIVSLHLNTEVGVEVYAQTSTVEKSETIRAAKYAFLGCWYLSSIIAVAFNRQISLQYSEFTETCLAQLELNAASSMDSLLGLMMRLQRIAEEAEFKMRSRTETLDTIKSTMDDLNAQLDRLQPKIESCRHPTAKLIGYYVTMQVNAIDLRSKSPYQVALLLPPNNGPSQPWRISAIERCFTAAQAYFQCFTSFPLSEYNKFTAAEWSSLVKATTIMSILSFDIPVIPEWDAASARQQSHFATYLESLCYRMQQLIQGMNDGETYQKSKSPNSFQLFKCVLEIVKEVYDENSGRSTVGNTSTPSSFSSGVTSCPILNGAIKNTEYWDMLLDSEFMDLLDVDILQPGFDSSSSATQDPWLTWEGHAS